MAPARRPWRSRPQRPSDSSTSASSWSGPSNRPAAASRRPPRPCGPRRREPLRRLARLAHRDTRFFKDASFDRPRVEELYAAWIARDLESHAVLVWDEPAVAGDQTYSRKCQAFLRDALGAPAVLVTTSCTHALEMAALLLDVGPGDEVIVPSFTFVSTANAFVLRGARPVFCDIRPDTLNIDESLFERAITPRTKAVVPVHYAGVGCDMDAILEIAGRRGLAVVEDNAHGLFGGYRGRMLGTFGQLAALSFHETKNITCGEGGALVVNDERFIERAEILREKGTNRARFFRGQVDRYSWVDVGSSYTMSDVLAAFLYGQLEQWRAIQARRAAIWRRYHEALAPWADRVGAGRPVVPAHCEPAFHMYQLLMPDTATRTRFIAALAARGVMAVFHYLPLHLGEYARSWGGRSGDCPVTESVSDRLVRLPFYTAMREDEQARVIEAVVAFAA